MSDASLLLGGVFFEIELVITLASPIIVSVFVLALFIKTRPWRRAYASA
jgi:hypothetical protein